MILGNIKNFEPGAGQRRFEQGRQKAREKNGNCYALAATPDGERKAEEAKRMIDLVRTSSGTANIRSTAWSAATSSTSRPCSMKPSARASPRTS